MCTWMEELIMMMMMILYSSTYFVSGWPFADHLSVFMAFS